MTHSKPKNIAVSCIGSGIGQSVINSLKLSDLPLRTIGFGNDPFAYGNYDCDDFDYLPSIYSMDYIDDLVLKCNEHQIDLLIPGHDDEALVLARNEKRLIKEGVNSIYSRLPLITLCRNKEKMSMEMNRINDLFVRAYDTDGSKGLSDLSRINFPLIAKPKDGFASRGVKIIRHIKDMELIAVNDVVQDLAIPHKGDPNHDRFMKGLEKGINFQVSEISIELVFDQNSALMGEMYSYNNLKNGVPVQILPYHDEELIGLINELKPKLIELGTRGPLNIQGRKTEEGFKIFDMNPRFTGITGIRALMGFNEVEACVKEWLGIDSGRNRLTVNERRFGTRQVSDRSLSLERNPGIGRSWKELNRGRDDQTRNLLITGSCGYLGRRFIRSLAGSDTFTIHAFDIDRERMKRLIATDVDHYYDPDDLTRGRLQLGRMDIILHMGFARPHRSNEQIADSLEFTEKLFTRAAMHQVPAIINISSQAVYGSARSGSLREDDPVAPDSPYAQAKYASEQLLRSLKRIYRPLNHTSIRLGTLSGGSEGLVEVDFLSKIIRKVFEGEDMNIIDGNQMIERLDIRDAVSALGKLISSDPQIWRPVYNLNSGNRVSLMDMAGIIRKISKEQLERDPGIHVIEGKPGSDTSMDSSAFRNDLQWKPRRSVEDSIMSYFQYLKEMS